MLIKATPDDITKYGDFVYRLALNPEKSCYPTYIDGIKTRADFFDAAKRAVSSETSELLLFESGGELEGWISYDWVPEDKYLQLNGFNINRATEQAMTELLERLQTRFAGYTAYFGFPVENHAAIRFLAGNGFRCIERDWNHSFFFDGFTPQKDSPCVEKISRRNLDKFRAVYHATPDTYWNADRICDAINNWLVYVYNDGNTPIATVFLTGRDRYYEVFGAEFSDGIFRENVLRELLTASLNACRRDGAKYLTYFCGENERTVLRQLGFQSVGQYVLYIKEL